MKYISTCVLNHTIKTRSKKKEEIWQKEHDHLDVAQVIYDDDGNIEKIIYV